MQNATFVKQGQDLFLTIEDVLWKESFQRIFFGSDTFRLSETEIKKMIGKKQQNFMKKLLSKNKFF